MFGGDWAIWISFMIISVGNSFNRMGPSFDRSRFGFPLMLLGLTCLVLLPDELTEGGKELHGPILYSISILFPLSIGAMLILHNSPTYGESSLPGLVSGWLLVTVSWVVLFSERNTFSILGAARGILVILGILVSLIAVIIGTYMAERLSGPMVESEPLSNEEGILVRTILERRLRRD
jgi:uncharacterized protein YneF (UPF0154 family)|tara:strand:- start:995 stop:1528 length:534 start_codon:yes stop_codon:yes gene_type:complete